MTAVQPHWRTSTRSGDTGGNCVEVADNLAGVVLVRDSKGPARPRIDVRSRVLAHVHRRYSPPLTGSAATRLLPAWRRPETAKPPSD